jgi:cysteine synthase B
VHKLAITNGRTSVATERSTTILDLVGNTPLLKLNQLTADLPPTMEVYAKAEWYNPGGSVKDRAALWMIQNGLQTGKLQPDMRIADATSGNTGIAYATIGAALGYQVTLAMPENASPERKRILRALGAELLLTDAAEGMDLAIRTIRDLVAKQPNTYFYPDQYNNVANAQSHYETTGPEIWDQTSGRVTHFVAALGTSGTLMGAGRRLRELGSSVKVVAVQPDGPLHAIEGVKHMATTAMVPGIYDPAFPDQIIEVTTEEAYAMARCLGRYEGLLVGISSGANVAAALKLARTLQDGVIVTILCDSAAKYLSDRFWDEPSNECVGGDGI